MKKIFFFLCVLFVHTTSFSQDLFTENILLQTRPEALSIDEAYVLIREEAPYILKKEHTWKYERVQYFPFPKEKKIDTDLKIFLQEKRGTKLRVWVEEKVIGKQYPPTLNKTMLLWWGLVILFTNVIIKSQTPREHYFTLLYVLIITLIFSFAYWKLGKSINRLSFIPQTVSFLVLASIASGITILLKRKNQSAT